MWVKRAIVEGLKKDNERMSYRADLAEIDLREAKEKLKSLEAKYAEAVKEIERLNNLVSERTKESFKEFIDEYINGPKDDRVEVIPWASGRTSK